MEFRKTNEAIGLRVVEGSLSLLTRKAFNVMVYHAQAMKEPGRNAPIKTGSSSKYFWMELADLARDASYGSNDTAYLKEQLLNMQDIKLHMENERQWTSERLVSSVTLVNPEGLNKRGGSVWLGFAFPPEVHELVMSPGAYTRLSLVYQSAFKSGQALGLYEVCRRYATNPSHMTYVQRYDHWYSVITGNPIPADPDGLPEYKYFKRDSLKPAIAEINQVSDIRVELIEHKSGRKVESLQFYVEEAKQTKIEFPAPPVVDMEMIGKIMAFGFSQDDAADIFAQHGDELVRQTISKVQARMEDTSLGPLRAPAAYFRWQITDLVKNPHAPGAPAISGPSKTKTKQSGGSSVLERFHTERNHAAYESFKAESESRRKELFAEFKAEPTNAAVNFERGLEGTMVRKLFSKWLAEKMWGAPTADDIAHFVELMGGS